MIPDELNITLEDSITKSAELRDEVARNPVAKRIMDQARVLEGMVRNTGKHAAGIIITDTPLEDFVPLTLQEGDVTVQYDMNAVGKLGLLKMDFLGLRNLDVITDTVEMIHRQRDPGFDIDNVPLDDELTFALLGRGETIEDTARVLSRFIHGLVVRTHAHAEVQRLAAAGSVPVINALTDLLHPCQIYTDAFTMAERWAKGRDLVGSLRGRKGRRDLQESKANRGIGSE